MATRIELGENAAEVLASLRKCRDLDEVLAVGQPAVLVKRLFGDSASKVLLDPFGDALIRGLSRPTPVLASIEFAVALAPFLDPKRLAIVLELDDEGFDLLADHGMDALADDLALLFSAYTDPGRRLKLAQSLWEESLRWNGQRARERAFLVETAGRATARLRGVIELTAVQGMTTNEQRQMLIDWLLGRFIAAETELLRYLALGHPFFTVPGKKRATSVTPVADRRLKTSVVGCMIAAERLTQALMDPPKTWMNGSTSQKYRWALNPQRWRIQRQRLSRLYQVAAKPRSITDATTASLWQDPATVYVGLDDDLELSFDPGHVARRPPPRATLPLAVGDVARFVRLGATMPQKPKDWNDLILRLMEPFYVHASLEIQQPNWVSKVNGATLRVTSGEPLSVRAPRDMRELAQWGSYMGNCVHSLFGDDVHDGSRVILGLFRNDVLTYNVGVHSVTGGVWEVNSRFNEGEVEPEVEHAVRALVSVASRPRLPSKTLPRVVDRIQTPTSSSRPRTANRWNARRVRDVGDALRALSLEGTVWRFALSALDSDPSEGSRAEGSRVEGRRVEGSWAEGSWADSVTRLSRLGTVELRTRFRQRMRSGDDIWPLLQTHPVDDLCTLDHVLYRRLNSREREAVRSIGSGSERLKLAGSSALLDDPTIGAAWELGRLQTTLRKEFAAFVVESPREVARSIRLSASASPRWTAALLWVQAADAGTVEHSGLRIVTFELPNESAGEAFRTFFRGMQTGELPASIDPTPNWIADRLSAGLALPQCPQIWLSR